MTIGSDFDLKLSGLSDAISELQMQIQSTISTFFQQQGIYYP
jgi:hypothetical protein